MIEQVLSILEHMILNFRLEILLENSLKDTFCNGTEYYKGVGFFYPKNEIELFNNSVLNPRTEEMHENLDDNDYYSEFALCSPNDYLSYLYTQKCMSLRKLSQPYRFDGRKFN